MRENVPIHVIELPDIPALVPVADRYADNGRPAVQLYEAVPADADDGLWCDLTVNLPDYVLPGDDWAFVPAEREPYLRELERRGLVEVGGVVAYGSFGSLACVVHLSPCLVAREEAPRCDVAILNWTHR